MQDDKKKKDDFKNLHGTTLFVIIVAKTVRNLVSFWCAKSRCSKIVRTQPKTIYYNNNSPA